MQPREKDKPTKQNTPPRRHGMLLGDDEETEGVYPSQTADYYERSNPVPGGKKRWINDEPFGGFLRPTYCIIPWLGMRKRVPLPSSPPSCSRNRTPAPFQPSSKELSPPYLRNPSAREMCLLPPSRTREAEIFVPVASASVQTPFT